MSKLNRRIIKYFAVLTIIFGLGKSLSAERACCEGDLWLKWSQERREAYVFGYTSGYSKGFASACSRASNETPPSKTPNPESDPVRKCRHEAPDFSVGSTDLANSITAFYQRYPTLRDIYATEILDLLGQGQTVEQIHRHEFPAHKSGV